MRRTALSALLVAGLGAAAGSGPAAAAERRFPVGAFDRLRVGGASDVVVTTGKAVSVRASGDEKALDRLDIRVENGALRIGTRNNSGWSWNSGNTRIAVTVPMLRSADVSGSGNVSVDRIDTPEFTADVAGSGNLTVPSLTAGRSRFSVAGSGNVHAAGRSADVKASVAGSGELDITGLKASSLNASVSGSGNVSAFATGNAAVSVAGSGDVRVRGGARCAISKSGSGSVDCG